MSEPATVATADDVAAVLVHELGTMDAMKLQKLLYYCQAWNLAITDHPLFSEAVEAWRDGPVVQPIFRRHRGRRLVSDWRSGDPSRLNEQARQLIDLVCMSYGRMSGDDLSTLTHSEEPWLEARRGVFPTSWSRKPISHFAMKNFFRGRQLAGRTSADLAAGGLALGASSPATDALSECINEIRASFRGQPAEHPDDSHGTVGHSRTGVDPEIAELLAKRRAKRMAG
jgi:uncharacterized phage-associated protein